MKIVRIRTYSLYCPLAQPMHDSQGRFDTQSALLVRITTDGGLDGWGECSGPCDAVADVLLRLLAPRLLGQCADDIEMLWSQMYRCVPPWARRGLFLSAVSGIDIALWDIKGKAAGRPLCELIGGRHRERIPCYASGLFIPEIPEAEILPTLLDEATQYVESGFRAVKLQIGRNLSYDASIVTAIRRRFPTLSLFAAGNRAYELSEAIHIGRILEENHYEWFEEPLGLNLPEQVRQLATAVRVPLAAGESEQGRWEFGSLILAGIGIVQPNLACCGGLSEAIKVRALASAHGVNLTPQVTGTAILVAASLHLLASEVRYPGRAEMPTGLLEYVPDSVSPLRDAISGDGIHVAHGVASVPDTPGLGVTVDEEALRILCLRREEVTL